MAIVVHHNPRCSKSRCAVELLGAKGIEPRIVEYLETPPSAEEIERLLRLLAIRPRDLMRKGEAEYRAAGLDDPKLSDTELVRAMAAHPILIERPIVVAGEKAVLARPPEAVLEIL